MWGGKEHVEGPISGLSKLSFSPPLDSMGKVFGCPLKLYNSCIEHCMALCTLQCSID